jgi:hypothetical protein
MRERAGLERELMALRARPTEPGTNARNLEIEGDWQKSGRWWRKDGLWESATLTTPEQDEDKDPAKNEGGVVKVEALKFPGRTKKVALVFAGVHGSEPQGVKIAEWLVALLKAAAMVGRKPEFTTIIVPKLITTRQKPRLEKLRGGKTVPASDHLRYVLVKKRAIQKGRAIEKQWAIEPNRNFPRPGEGYDYAVERGKRRSDGAELLDRSGKNLKGSLVTDRMIAETRILVQLVEREKPVRAVSIHAKRTEGAALGNGPGIFVDPRGGFNKGADKAYTTDGQEDDALAFGMLDDARAMFKERKTGKKLSPENKSDKTFPNPFPNLTHPFQGNLGNPREKTTAHYRSDEHPLGTSFGEWAPAIKLGDKRQGVTTLTVEVPRYEENSEALNVVIGILTKILAKRFLGLL